MRITEGQAIDDKFEIRGVIGSGGMGVVYDAYQLALERAVALKLIRPEAVEDESDVARFEREALTLSRLSHRNIVRFYGYGRWEGLNYIVMERLKGSSLQDHLAECKPLDRDTALPLLVQVCDGLYHAHEAGIVHRDLKPSNIFLAPSATGEIVAKIIDFGLARLMGPVPVQKLTQDGAAIGSVLFMSPEQCMGLPADERSDIYSIGAILHTVLTGVPPFTADSAAALLFMHTNEPVQNSQRWDTLREREQRVIKKCLAKAPTDRYSSIASLREDLNRLMSGLEPELEGGHLPSELKFGFTKATLLPDGTIRKSKNLLPLLGVALLLATVSGAGVTMWWQSQPKVVPVMPEDVRNVKEELSWLVYHLKADPLTDEQRKHFDDVIQKAKLDPLIDKNMLARAYCAVVVEAATHGEHEFVRKRSKEAVELCDNLTHRFAKEAFAALLNTYHNSCKRTNCHASLKPILEDVLKRYPEMSELHQATLKLCLAADYAYERDTKRARQYLRESSDWLTEPEMRSDAASILIECDQIDRANATKGMPCTNAGAKPGTKDEAEEP